MLHKEDQTVGESVVHLKGFVRGLELEPDAEAIKAALALEELLTCSALCWDGDQYAVDSFTRLIPMLMERRSSNPPQLLAFFNADKEVVGPSLADFNRSWSEMPHTIECRELNVPEAENPWEQLGVTALKTTCSSTVVCFGGGRTVSNERMQASCKCTFSIVEVSRGGERPAIRPTAKLEGSNIPEGTVYRVQGGSAAVVEVGSNPEATSATPPAVTACKDNEGSTGDGSEVDEDAGHCLFYNCPCGNQFFDSLPTEECEFACQVRVTRLRVLRVL
jgi:hypothetical protein